MAVIGSSDESTMPSQGQVPTADAGLSKRVKVQADGKVALIDENLRTRSQLNPLNGSQVPDQKFVRLGGGRGSPG